MEIHFHDDGSWSYVEDTILIVHGRSEPFVHKDSNRLIKTAEADFNPWYRIARGQKAR